MKVQMKILSNHHRRELVSWHEVSDAASKAAFGYVGDNTEMPRFVHYKGEWYDVFEFQSAPKVLTGWDGLGMSEWDGYFPDSFYSGVLVKFLHGDDEGFVQIGRYYT